MAGELERLQTELCVKEHVLNEDDVLHVIQPKWVNNAEVVVKKLVKEVNELHIQSYPQSNQEESEVVVIKRYLPIMLIGMGIFTDPDRWSSIKFDIKMLNKDKYIPECKIILGNWIRKFVESQYVQDLNGIISLYCARCFRYFKVTFKYDLNPNEYFFNTQESTIFPIIAEDNTVEMHLNAPATCNFNSALQHSFFYKHKLCEEFGETNDDCEDIKNIGDILLNGQKSWYPDISKEFNINKASQVLATILSRKLFLKNRRNEKVLFSTLQKHVKIFCKISYYMNIRKQHIYAKCLFQHGHFKLLIYAIVSNDQRFHVSTFETSNILFIEDSLWKYKPFYRITLKPN